MFQLIDKQVLVIGLGSRGQAMCRLLSQEGAKVVGVDCDRTPALCEAAENLQQLGVQIGLGVLEAPARSFDFAVLTPARPRQNGLLKAIRRQNLPVVSELELGFREAKCLTVAIAGTNGKGTTAELIERMLSHNHRRTSVAGQGARPVASVLEAGKELDFLILPANSFQLEATNLFRPTVAVLLNLAPAHLDYYTSAADYVRACAHVFVNQQAFDWAIVQAAALSTLRDLNLPVPGKTITFSAT